MIYNMNKTKYIFVLLCLITTNHIFSQSGKNEPYVVHLPKPNSGGYLTVNNSDGSIKVTGYNGSDVLIRSSIKNKKEFREYVSVVNEFKNNGVIISTNSDDYPIDLDISVPYSFSITATTEEGRIEIRDISGELVINDTNGEIRLINISGYGLISTVDGRITASISKAGMRGSFMFNSIDGRIDLVLPAETRTTLSLKSDSGDLYTDFNIRFNTNGNEISKKSGLTRYSMEEWLYGKINGGGQTITIKTVDGNVYIKKAK